MIFIVKIEILHLKNSIEKTFEKFFIEKNKGKSHQKQIFTFSLLLTVVFKEKINI